MTRVPMDTQSRDGNQIDRLSEVYGQKTQKKAQTIESQPIKSPEHDKVMGDGEITSRVDIKTDESCKQSKRTDEEIGRKGLTARAIDLHRDLIMSSI